MKKMLCFLLCLTLIFSSVSLCFATPVDWDSSDHTHLTEIRNALVSGGVIYNLINSCNSNLVNINYNILTLMGWLDPSTGGSQTAILSKILGALTYAIDGTNLGSWLADIWQTTSANLPGIYTNLQNHDLAHTYFYQEGRTTPNGGTGQWQNIWFLDGITGTASSGAMFFRNTDPIGMLPTYLYAINTNMMNTGRIFSDRFYNLNNQFDASQSYTDWTDLNSSSFTPVSGVNGIYQWLSKIQTPTARLAYVLASDERIAAQEAAAANEEAVVDNFIDSTGNGSMSPSNIGSVSDLSAGYKQNFGTDASPSGIFDIFNADHASWFSQETKNQLDTTTSTRLTKGSQSETPLLDKQIEDIYNALGVKQP